MERSSLAPLGQAGSKGGAFPVLRGRLLLNSQPRILLGHVQWKAPFLWRKPWGLISSCGDVPSVAVPVQPLFFHHVQLYHQGPCLPLTALQHSPTREEQVAPWEMVFKEVKPRCISYDEEECHKSKERRDAAARKRPRTKSGRREGSEERSVDYQHLGWRSPHLEKVRT